MKVKITKKIIDEIKVVNSVKEIEAGAVVTFLGTARKTSRNRDVLYLEYDAYPEMAEKKMMSILQELDERYGVTNAAFIHRIGRVELGETIVAISVSAPHSKEAFEASRYAVKRLKSIVPIWKKEVWTNGEEWIGYEGEHSEYPG
ncbi:MAG: molybdenum cofactor biosynthesis protein MoaE [Candidatus Marinimicrobia bacterium]|nr:molybdenum cofactor biosynthesis protein MoaE [Candidatus Neomarinimicrobiota bacterium]